MRYRFGSYRFDGVARTLTSAAGAASTLTPKAARLLELLLDAAPHPLTRDAAYEQLWPGTFVEPGNLHNLISEIRHALGEAGHATLQTVHGTGYAVTAEVRRESDVRFQLALGPRELPLPDGDTVIGREQTATPDVSRRHARFTVDGETVYVEDLGSKNGTYVDGIRINTRTEIDVRSDITLGRTHAVLHHVAASTVTVTR